MKVLALDLSTSTGVALFVDEVLKDHTSFVCKVKGKAKGPTYPFNYIEMAEEIALRVAACIYQEKPDFIVIEETNKGKERFRQKQLEFIHFACAKSISKLDPKPKVHYMDTSLWRKVLGLSLSSEQRSSNKERKKERDTKRLEIYNNIRSELNSKIMSEIEGLKKRESNKIINRWEKEIQKLVGNEMKKIRSSIKVVDQKNLSVDYVNETFNLDFKKSQNDIADAICVGHAFIKNNYSSLNS